MLVGLIVHWYRVSCGTASGPGEPRSHRTQAVKVTKRDMRRWPGGLGERKSAKNTPSGDT